MHHTVAQLPVLVQEVGAGRNTWLWEARLSLDVLAMEVHHHAFITSEKDFTQCYTDCQRQNVSCQCPIHFRIMKKVPKDK